MKLAIVSIAAVLTLLSTNYPPHTAQADKVDVKIKLENVYQKQVEKFPDRTIEYTTAKKADEAHAEALRIAEAQRVAQVTVQAQTPVIQPVDNSDAKTFIYMKESGNNPNSINRSSGACGLGQALPCSKMGCALGDYACQDAFFTKYMLARYGSWENAKAFWLSHKYW